MKDIIKISLFIITMVLVVVLIIKGGLWIIKEDEKSDKEFREKRKAEFSECLDRTAADNRNTYSDDWNWCFDNFVNN
jgi:hypothetical protein